MAIFSALSWNLHRCRGMDGLVQPDRILDVLGKEVWVPGTDALVFQEADAECPPHGGLLDIGAVEAITGLRSIHSDPAQRWSRESSGFLGVVLLVHPSVAVRSVHLVDLPGRCHRGAVVADLEREGQSFHLIGTHLSLWQGLRWAQLRTISQFLFRQAPKPAVLVGDLNEWRFWGGFALSPRLLGAKFAGPAPATFPVGRPLLPLDRILATPPAEVLETKVLDGAGIRIASDHRPIWGKVSLT